MFDVCSVENKGFYNFYKDCCILICILYVYMQFDSFGYREDIF